MRNAIQHARHHIAPRNKILKNDQWREGAEEENFLRDCRIQTLQKHNPWKIEEEEEKEREMRKPQQNWKQNKTNKTQYYTPRTQQRKNTTMEKDKQRSKKNGKISGKH